MPEALTPQRSKGQVVYFDNAASSRRSPAFVGKYIESLRLRFDDSEKLGILSEMCALLADALGVSPPSISFVPNATYGLNEVALHLSRLHPDGTVHLSTAEHSSNHAPWLRFFSKPISYFHPSQLSSLELSEPSIVSLSPLTNLEGLEVPMGEIEAVASRGNTVVVDASQLIQHSIPDLSSSQIDFLVFSAHKAFGPNGIGVVYSRTPCGLGINHLNYSQRSPDYSLDYAGLRAWTAAFGETLALHRSGHIEMRERELNRYFRENFPPNRHIVLSNPRTRSCIFLLEVVSPDITAQDYAFYLARNGVAVRSGLSCSRLASERHDPNRTIRVSLGFMNTEEELDYLFGLIEKFGVLDCF